MSFTNDPPTTALRKTSTRFDSLKNETSSDYSGYRNSRDNRNHTETNHRSPQPSSALFSVKNTSLADFIPGSSAKSATQKYVSPAMRQRQQQQQANSTHCPSRTQFTSVNQRKPQKKGFDISGAAFPSMYSVQDDVRQSNSAAQQPTTNKYAAAAAMDDDDYQTQQRQQVATMNDNTEYQDTDFLGKTQYQGSCSDDEQSYYSNAEVVNYKEPICPYAAGKAAMSMLRVHQYRRDELNDLLGGQSPYWNTKSLLDFTVDSDDSNYDSSSEPENNEDEES